MRRISQAFLVAAVFFAVSVAIFFACRPRMPLTGDEPHYLIIADSVFADHDLQLENNYKQDFVTGRIFGPMAPHVYNVPRGWMPYHMPGLGMLLAVPFGLGGLLGARLALLLLASAIPWTLTWWLGDRVPARIAAWTTLGVTLAFPLVFGGAEIYPDLPAGAIATVLTIWLVSRDESGSSEASWFEWTVFGLAVGVLPWLHVKYLAMAGVLLAGGIVVGARGGRRGRYAAAWMSLLVLAGVGSFVAFNIWAFGPDRPLGVRGARELTTSAGRAMEMFLGLHLDQSQGMFVQDPLLLAGVAAFPLFARLRPRLALFWLVLYGSAIVPNSLEAARFGGGGPIGRFAWTAAWLWTIPAGVIVRAYWPALARYIRPAVVLSLAYQCALAVRWIRQPEVLYPHLDPPRDSPFPDLLRPWLPSFYFWDFSSYWRFVPNIIAMLVVLAVFAAGAGWSGKKLEERS